MLGRPGETGLVMFGTWAMMVWVGSGVNEGETEGMGVLNCGSNEVLVGDGMTGGVDVEPGILV